MVVFSAGLYFFKPDDIAEVFQHLGYPTYIIYPLAIVRILGFVVIWSNYSKTLKEWAYAGLFYDFVVALSAHYNAGDERLAFAPPIFTLSLLAISYFANRRVHVEIEKEKI